MGKTRGVVEVPPLSVTITRCCLLLCLQTDVLCGTSSPRPGGLSSSRMSRLFRSVSGPHPRSNPATNPSSWRTSDSSLKDGREGSLPGLGRNGPTSDYAGTYLTDFLVGRSRTGAVTGERNSLFGLFTKVRVLRTSPSVSGRLSLSRRDRTSVFTTIVERLRGTC